jgi:hypothetical protein
MLDSTTFEPGHFSVERHGDSQERGNAKFLLSKVPAYQEFWAHHVVPLTCRIYDENLRFVRPFLRPRMLMLANCSYATMYHLTWSESYRARVAAHFPKERALQAEALYCFLCHTTSFLDALGSLAQAVDRVISSADFRGVMRPPFGVSKHSGCFHWSFAPSTQAVRLLVASRRRFRERICALRNTVVHDCPIYIVQGRVPPAEMLPDYLGLAAMSQAVVAQGQSLVAWMPLAAELGSLVVAQSELANGWYRASHQALNTLPRAKYRELQWDQAARGRGLTQQDFDRFLGK